MPRLLRLFPLLALLCAIAAPSCAAILHGRVVQIADGDTITVLVSTTRYRVRLYGIDAPEQHQAYGGAATKYAKTLALGQNVSVAVKGIDRYGRTIGDVTLPDGHDLSREMAWAGLAWWYSAYAPHDTALQDEQADAQRNERGLWSEPQPVPPWEFRRATAALALSQRHRP